MDICLSVRNLCKSYGSLPVLERWSLDVHCGERLILLGPSGAGKTTFLKIVAGLESAGSGTLRQDKMRTGFVFQEPRLIPWRNVRDNLLFVNPQGDCRGILSHMGLSEFRHYLPAQLSGGMRQRVNLARALMVEPDLLILDEAFHSLDLGVKIKIMRDVEKMWRRRKFTLIAVTHDPKEALFMADRIVLLSARPAHIIQEMHIDLGLDRNLSAPEFLQRESLLVDMLCRGVMQSNGSREMG